MNWQKFFQNKTIFNYILLPLSFVFKGLVSLRHFLYKKNILKSYKSKIPIIIIGGINVGGSGKTPLVIALGELLAENNIKFAVISRGYGADFEGNKEVLLTNKANETGDEPLLIKTKLNCPVFVGQNRVNSVKLIEKNYPEIKIILTDDGLQHYKLQADLKICVVNSQYKFGNGWMLPAGPLREPKSSLKNIDFIVSNGGVSQEYHYKLTFLDWSHINSNTKEITKKYHDEFINNENIVAISGIANPNNFFNTLTDLGIESLKTISYPDHYKYTGAEMLENKTILMTEKDWIKLKEFKHNDAWFLNTKAILSSQLKKDFMEKVNKIKS